MLICIILKASLWYHLIEKRSIMLKYSALKFSRRQFGTTIDCCAWK